MTGILRFGMALGLLLAAGLVLPERAVAAGASDGQAPEIALPDDLSKPEVPQVQRVRALLTSLVSAYAAGDGPGVQTASAGLASRLANIAPGVYPSERDLAMEVHYNRTKPFRTAWISSLSLATAEAPRQVASYAWLWTSRRTSKGDTCSS